MSPKSKVLVAVQKICYKPGSYLIFIVHDIEASFFDIIRI